MVKKKSTKMQCYEGRRVLHWLFCIVEMHWDGCELFLYAWPTYMAEKKYHIGWIFRYM